AMSKIPWKFYEPEEDVAVGYGAPVWARPTTRPDDDPDIVSRHVRSEGHEFKNFNDMITKVFKQCWKTHPQRQALFRAIERFAQTRGIRFDTTTEKGYAALQRYAAIGVGGDIAKNPRRWTEGLHVPDPQTLKLFNSSVLFDICDLVEPYAPCFPYRL